MVIAKGVIPPCVVVAKAFRYLKLFSVMGAWCPSCVGSCTMSQLSHLQQRDEEFSWSGLDLLVLS